MHPSRIFIPVFEKFLILFITGILIILHLYWSCAMEEQNGNLKKALLLYAEKQLSSFNENLLTCRETFSKKNIHNLRLAIKNLKAIVILSKELSINRRGSGQLPRDMVLLFDLLGKYRDLQISAEILEDHSKELKTSFPKYDRLIRRQKKVQYRKISRLVKKFKPGLSLKRILLAFNRGLDHYPEEHLLKEKISSYIIQSWTEIEAMLKQRHNRSNLHSIRIKLKHLYYILIVIKEVEHTNRIIPIQPELLESFQDLLGKWHDMIVFYKRTREYYSKGKSSKKNLIKTYFLMGNIKKRKDRLNRKIADFCTILMTENKPVI